MSKILALMIAGLFAAGAYAQGAKEIAQEKGPETDSKAQQRAEMKKEAKPAGKVVLPMGDTDKAQEANPTVTDKATITGEKRAETRENGLQARICRAPQLEELAVARPRVDAPLPVHREETLEQEEPAELAEADTRQ